MTQINGFVTVQRAFRPVYIDHYQAESYRHVLTVFDGAKLFAVFADGKRYESVYPTIDAMLSAGAKDYRERVREVPIG